MTLESLVSNYGYLAILIGSFLEGETILILGGITAKLGYLKLDGVMLSAFIGSFAGDQLYFFLGRAKGKDYLEKHPRWHKRADKIFELLKRREIWVILGFRFLYGLRTITPFVIGMSHISTAKFILLNIIGAGMWSIVIALVGYIFGHTFDLLFGEIKHYEVALLVTVAISGALLWIYTRIRERKSAHKQS